VIHTMTEKVNELNHNERPKSSTSFHFALKNVIYVVCRNNIDTIIMVQQIEENVPIIDEVLFDPMKHLRDPRTPPF